MRKTLKNISYLLTIALCTTNLVGYTKIEAKAARQTMNCIDDPTFNSMAAPHGNHYALLTNDKQRLLYDTFYKAALPQYIGTDTVYNAYKVASGVDEEYFDELDYKFARKAVIYDNPNKIEYTLAGESLDSKVNPDGGYDFYAGVVANKDYANYSAMNTQFESDMDTIVNAVKEAGYVDFSTEESTAISLFKLSFFFAPTEPADRDMIPAWHNVEYTRSLVNDNCGIESSAYGTVHNKLACCVGMSQAYTYLLRKLGFNDCLVEDVALVNGHAWNLVKIGGAWYTVDVTNTMSEDGTFGFENAGNKLSWLFSAITPTATNPKYTGWYIYSLLYPERFTGDPSENPSNSSSESTTTETPSNSGSEGSSSSESPSNSNNAGSTVNPNENGGSASSNSSSSTSTETTNNNNNSGNSNTAQPSKPSSSDNGNSNSNASAQPADTKKDEQPEDTSKVEKETKTTNITPATPKSVSAKVSKNTITVKWKKQTKNTTGYEIQYSTDKKFKKNLKTVTVKKSATKTTIKKLKAKKTYYVRIRTKCKNGKKTSYSKWSKVMKVKIK